MPNLKEAFFEVFVAGFQAGYMQSIDVVTAYEEWWKDNVEGLLNGN